VFAQARLQREHFLQEGADAGETTLQSKLLVIVQQAQVAQGPWCRHGLGNIAEEQDVVFLGRCPLLFFHGLLNLRAQAQTHCKGQSGRSMTAEMEDFTECVASDVDVFHADGFQGCWGLQPLYYCLDVHLRPVHNGRPVAAA